MLLPGGRNALPFSSPSDLVRPIVIKQWDNVSVKSRRAHRPPAQRNFPTVKQHQLLETEDGIQCPLQPCTDVFPTQRDIEKHVMQHCLEIDRCLLCPDDDDEEERAFSEKYARASFRLKHLRSHFPSTFPCSFDGCPYMATNEQLLQSHEGSHLGRKQFKRLKDRKSMLKEEEEQVEQVDRQKQEDQEDQEDRQDYVDSLDKDIWQSYTMDNDREFNDNSDDESDREDSTDEDEAQMQTSNDVSLSETNPPASQPSLPLPGTTKYVNHAGDFNCECGETLKDRHKLRMHKLEVCRLREYDIVHECPECHRHFSRYSTFDDHRRNAHARPKQILGFAVQAGLFSFAQPDLWQMSRDVIFDAASRYNKVQQDTDC